MQTSPAAKKRRAPRNLLLASLVESTPKVNHSNAAIGNILYTYTYRIIDMFMYRFITSPSSCCVGMRSH
jgi:hypothetical protein